MSGASDSVDPVEAARDDVERSKHVIASALDDLSHHHSWLESYHRDERRRAERLRRQEELRRLERRRQRMAVRLRRTAMAFWRGAMAFFAASWKIITFIARNLVALVKWTAPRAYALTVLLGAWLAAAASWTWRATAFVTRKGFLASTVALAWMVRASDILGVAFRKHLSVAFTWLGATIARLAAPSLNRAGAAWTRTRHRTKRLAIALSRTLAEEWARLRSVLSRWVTVDAPNAARGLARSGTNLAGRTRVRAGGAALAGLKIASDGWSHAAHGARRIVQRTVARGSASSLNHRALVVRQSTALVCFKPRRTRLPVVRAG